MMIKEACQIGKILTVEENILEGGFGSAVLEQIERHNLSYFKFKRIGIEGFVEHGEVGELKIKNGLTAENIHKESLDILKINVKSGESRDECQGTVKTI